MGVKSFKAKGKRLSTWTVETVEELEPTRFPEPETADAEEDKPTSEEERSTSEREIPTEEDNNLDPDRDKTEQQVIDEMTGQLSLSFPDDDSST